MFDALSLLLPAGETFLIETLRTWRAQSPTLCDAALHDEIERFIREEGAHQRAHARYNAALIAALPGAQAVASRADRVADGLAGLGPPMKIALAAAFEQLTTLVSREIVEHDTLLVDDGAQPARLWRWHAREELGHATLHWPWPRGGPRTGGCAGWRSCWRPAIWPRTLVPLTWRCAGCDIAPVAPQDAVRRCHRYHRCVALPRFARMAALAALCHLRKKGRWTAWGRCDTRLRRGPQIIAGPRHWHAPRTGDAARR
ncbi:metal-dependent hydrolase [Ralstonia solanacearum]|uniref:metal-dependent hydrolase n=1 Tax=Ralstonia solanacearum TaxID=305 RepID=UPI00361354B0